MVSAFAWEPSGSKFAFVHGESPRICVSFYKIGEEKISLMSRCPCLVFPFLPWLVFALTGNFDCELNQFHTTRFIETLEKKACNSLFWCPTGQFIVLAGLRNMNGVLEFIDTSDMTVMGGPHDHFSATDIEWDPTGRYVTSAVSAWGQKVSAKSSAGLMTTRNTAES